MESASDREASALGPPAGILAVEEEPGLSEDQWRRLLKSLAAGRCTPFLGAGASAEWIRPAADIAQAWALSAAYPLTDPTDLRKVSQYLSVSEGPDEPRERMARECGVKRPKYRDTDLYSVLAGLRISVYLTTNYDSLLAYALEAVGKKPVRQICRWNGMLESEDVRSDYKPSEEEPLVFHLHGHCETPESMVLTEDDYLDFLVRLTEEQDLLPPAVQRAVTRGCMLFLGYSLSDWNFQVVYRLFKKQIPIGQQPSHVSVQLNPLPGGVRREVRQRARDYLNRYFSQQQVFIYWGTCEKFALELRSRWERFLAAEHSANDAPGMSASRFGTQ